MHIPGQRDPFCVVHWFDQARTRLPEICFFGMDPVFVLSGLGQYKWRKRENEEGSKQNERQSTAVHRASPTRGVRQLGCEQTDVRSSWGRTKALVDPLIESPSYRIYLRWGRIYLGEGSLSSKKTSHAECLRGYTKVNLAQVRPLWATLGYRTSTKLPCRKRRESNGGRF